ncbi:hypothetical protein ANCCAN_12897 [Ancylostoma caninum]|uniref:Uncharacterized protein n=1 Tax=Ancylostoma caninum TaxID=29170 RepID=A0A368G9X7_ANCCA|nr:hypothetical protein ANCCAN_12897 [Ancylostoma caninum]
MFLSFFISLGDNDQQLERMLKILVRDRLKWKAKLFKALQRALKDIRGYTYCDSGSGFRWIPNNRQSKAAPNESIERRK